MNLFAANLLQLYSIIKFCHVVDVEEVPQRFAPGLILRFRLA